MQAVSLLTIASGLGLFVLALHGIAHLFYASMITHENLPNAWMRWWVDDTVGVLMVLLLILLNAFKIKKNI